MKRILVADDDDSIRLVVEETLQDEYEVRVAEKPSVAIGLARNESFDLVLSDVNMPEMNGFWMCKEIRKLPGCESIPCLFMSSADERAELDIAHLLGGHRLLLKPFSLDALLRAVRAVLGEARVEKGEVTRVLASIVSRAGTDKETGILTTVDGGICKRFVFRDGSLVFASSNDRQDLIGQSLIRAGVISERDLVDAFAASASAAVKGPQLAAALTSMRKLTPEQCQSAFVAKVRESFLDVFLWETGSAEFIAGAVEGAENPFPLAIELGPLSAEGSRRRARWDAVRALLPAPDDQIERAASWPPWFPKNAGDERLARHIDRGVSLGELFVELRGQRYAVGVKIAQLAKEGVIRAVAPVGFTGSASQEPSAEEMERARLELELSDRLQRAPGGTDPRIVAPGPLVLPEPLAPTVAEAALAPASHVEEASAGDATSQAFAIGLMSFRAGDLDGARETFARVLKSDPLNELARLRLAEVEEAMVTQAHQRGLRHERRIRLAVSISTLVGRHLPPADAFLLSRLVHSPHAIGDLVLVSPLPECDMLEAVGRLLETGILADEMLPIRLRAEYRTANEAVQELTRAVSKSEISIETTKPLPVGTRFAFEIVSPELDKPLEMSGIVTFVVEHGLDADGASAHGMTVKYLFDSEEKRQRVEAAVASILRTAEADVRRVWPRVPTAFKVSDASDPYRTTYTIRNLSQGGMLLVSDSPDLAGDTVLVGTGVRLVIVSAGRTHEILGTVVWTTGRSKASAGGALGVRFDPGGEAIVTGLMRMTLIPQSLSIFFG